MQCRSVTTRRDGPQATLRDLLSRTLISGRKFVPQQDRYVLLSATAGGSSQAQDGSGRSTSNTPAPGPDRATELALAAVHFQMLDDSGSLWFGG